MSSLFQKAEALFSSKSNDDTNAIKDRNIVKLLETRQKIHEKSLYRIDFSRAILRRGGFGIIFPNTINVIQGKKGVHKSRLTETLCITFLDLDSNCNHIGFSRELLQKTMLLYVDTERNQNDQLPFAMQNIRRKSGFPINQNPPHFDFISLVDIPRKDRFETLKRYIDIKQKEFTDYHFIIILDVVTDCIENFNDPKESLKLIDLMNELVNQKDVTFVCVIHENPGGEKARGHLGTEIINKASQVIQIAFDGDSKELLVVKFLHSRNTRQIDSIFLKYDEESKGLIEADIGLIKQVQTSREEKAPTKKIEIWIKENLKEEIRREALITNLREHFQCGEKTIEERLKNLVEEDIISKSRRGNTIYYSLKVNF